MACCNKTIYENQHTGCNKCVDKPKCDCQVSKPCGCPQETTCNVCEQATMETAYFPCDWPTYCTDGCLDTVSDLCAIYKGPNLNIIDVPKGKSLRDALTKIDAILQTQANAINTILTNTNKVVSFRHTLQCGTNIKLKTIKKNGVALITTETSYATLSAFQGYMTTLDSNFMFTGLEMSIKSTDFWEIETSC